MILTGLYLWLPRGTGRLGGLLYPRLGQRGRLFWRDLHAVTGLWISMVTLFLLLSGLPWSVNWGNYLTWARNHWAATAGAPDWPIGGKEQPVPGAAASASPDAPKNSMPGMTADEMAAMSGAARTDRSEAPTGSDLRALDRVASAVARLDAPRPVWIQPPPKGARDWIISSHIQNRPLRVTYMIDPDSGEVSATSGFAQQNIVDKVVNVAIATHEGQLFGRLNQAILLLNAVGVLLLSISAGVMWWRRRPTDKLGAPPPMARPHFSALLAVSAAILTILLPLFGLSLLLVLAIERVLLRRLPAARRWLGLAQGAA